MDRSAAEILALAVSGSLLCVGVEDWCSQFYCQLNHRKEQAFNLKEVEFDKPIILQRYGDYREETFPRTWKVQAGRTVTSKLPYDKPQIPVVKRANTAQRKLHYRLNDGSSFIYYPSEYLAVCQSCCNLPCRGMYTNIFSPSPDHSIGGTFTSFGHGSIYLPNRLRKKSRLPTTVVTRDFNKQEAYPPC